MISYYVCEIQRTVTFEQLIEFQWNFVGIQVSTRTLDNNLNQVDIIFSPKVVVLSNNHKNYQKIQRTLIFRCQ